ncbi:hypothetical protein [Kutzneria albida]|uniref:Secreted protein n=1 Tax=Kutzneria albida DSM 43870 TaxID=1449976 RepID=W5WNT8_9PSEU|nr:hypothetical protein [Kutzneria albida]AHH99834.1 hypothetical protein KALB_6475 [Kutzneria albida DSM 43870]
MLVRRAFVALATVLSFGLVLAPAAGAATQAQPRHVDAAASGFTHNDLNPRQSTAYSCGDTVWNWPVTQLTFRNCSDRAVEVLPAYNRDGRHTAYFNAGVVRVPAHSAVQWRIYFADNSVRYETVGVNRYNFGFGDIQFLDEDLAAPMVCGSTDHPSVVLPGATDFVYKNCGFGTRDAAPGYQVGDRHYVYVNGGIVDLPAGQAVAWHFRMTEPNAVRETLGLDLSTSVN